MELGVKQESFRMEVVMKNLQSECFNKCVVGTSSLSTNELTVEEVNCLDKCSWKYLTVDKLLNAALSRGSQPHGADKRK